MLEKHFYSKQAKKNMVLKYEEHAIKTYADWIETKSKLEKVENEIMNMPQDVMVKAKQHLKTRNPKDLEDDRVGECVTVLFACENLKAQMFDTELKHQFAKSTLLLIKSL
jgi:hypothetical protein